MLNVDSSGVDGEKNDSVIGVVGSSTFLSCNMTPPSITDKVYLVLWFKDNKPLPIYSYDAREFTKKRSECVTGSFGMKSLTKLTSISYQPH